MKDCKGNKVEIGIKLKSIESSGNAPIIICTEINGNIAKFRSLTFDNRKEIVINKKDLANSKWIVVRIH